MPAFRHRYEYPIYPEEKRLDNIPDPQKTPMRWSLKKISREKISKEIILDQRKLCESAWY